MLISAVFAPPNDHFPPRPSNDSFQPQALNNLTFQNLPISDQVIMILGQKPADRILKFLISTKTGKLDNVNISQSS